MAPDERGAVFLVISGAEVHSKDNFPHISLVRFCPYKRLSCNEGGPTRFAA